MGGANTFGFGRQSGNALKLKAEKINAILTIKVHFLPYNIPILSTSYEGGDERIPDEDIYRPEIDRYTDQKLDSSVVGRLKKYRRLLARTSWRGLLMALSL